MAEEKRAASPMDRVWDFFISVKLAIVTLIILAVASIFGTIVEQNQPPEKYHQIYEDWAYALMDRLNLFDMYHSWWFLLLLVLFTVNLACCTLDRSPKVLKVVRNPRTRLDENLEKTLSNGLTYTDDATLEVKNNIVIQGNQGTSSGTKQDYSVASPSLSPASNNLSSDSSAPGTSSLTSKTAANNFVSTVGGSEDLHLKEGADAIDTGADLSTTGGVNYDIDNRDVDALGDTWDMGADEYVSTGATRRRIGRGFRR